MGLTTLAQVAPADQAKPDNAGDKFKQILAYIPTEIVALYTAGAAYAGAIQQQWVAGGEIFIFVLCACAAPLWVFTTSQNSTKPLPRPSLIWREVAAFVAFLVWGFEIVDGKYFPPFLGVPVELWKACAGFGIIILPVLFQWIGSIVDKKVVASISEAQSDSALVSPSTLAQPNSQSPQNALVQPGN